MKRGILFLICAGLGVVALMGGLEVPAYLRATDARVLGLAGRKTPSLVEKGEALARGKRVESARLLAEVAQATGAPGEERLRKAVGNRGKKVTEPETEPFTEFIIKTENRERALTALEGSPNPGVHELLRTRALTNMTVFSASASAAGQAFDATVAMTGVLLQEGRLTGDLSNAVVTLAAGANRGGDTERFENMLLDVMSLGQRFDEDQLASFVGRINDTATLHTLTDAVRNQEKDVPVIFAAVAMSDDPALVARYLTTFSKNGVEDLRASLRYGTGGVKELLSRNLRLRAAGGVGDPLGLDLALKNPPLALMLKWSLYLLAGFLFGLGLHCAKPAVPELERPLQVRGFHVARETLFALGFLLVVLLLSEPFLAQESQKADYGFRLRLPTVGSVVPAVAGAKNTSFMNQLSLLTLLLFFVLQGLIYTACLLKLAEVRRQQVSARIKLRLLDNEEHLFDAGLYLGFVGTIISLILVSLGVIKPSLMAAYSSTSFGIIFVSIFKIFHLRPYKRTLLLESENVATTAEPVAPARPYSAPL